MEESPDISLHNVPERLYQSTVRDRAARTATSVFIIILSSSPMTTIVDLLKFPLPGLRQRGVSELKSQVHLGRCGHESADDGVNTCQNLYAKFERYRRFDVIPLL